ncbi:MAG: DUF4194 domain-containing protein [Bdellovibrionales bacterium]
MQMDKAELEVAGCLRRLLRSRYILRSRHENAFKLIVDHRNRLQEIVGSFGAFLEVNEPLGVTYLRVGSDEMEEKLDLRLSRTRTLGPFATALILSLRWQRLQFYLQPTGDDVPIAGLVEMREFLLQFSKAKIDAQFERQFRRCLEELVDLQVIVETSSGSGFYEITSLCDLLLPADQIQELKARAEVYFGRGGVAEENADVMEDADVG